MVRNIRSTKRSIFIFAVIMGLFGFTNPGMTQLSLVSSTPSDGETNVGTVATFTFTFSEALDTTARFEEGPDFLPFLALELYPDSAGTPENIIISVDLKTITLVNMPLITDTRFFLFLSGARSSAGEGLDRPYAITFTTGNSLPTATVSGTINYTGGDASGTAIALFQQAPFSDDDGGILAGGVVPIGSFNLGHFTTLGTGDFTINYVPAGEYVVLAFKDVNMDGELELINDAFGGYDSNSDKVADFITVGDGATISNIDIDINIIQTATAGENSATSETLAKTQAADAVLTAVFGGDLSPNGDGLAPIWNYLYYSANEDSLFSVVSFVDLFFLDPFVFGDDGDDGLQSIFNTPLPDNWIDSDLAADSAWANGGSEFVSSNPALEISVGLFNLPLSDPGMLKNSRNWRSNSQYKDPNYLNYFKKVSADTDTVAVWFFSFYSDSTNQFFGIGVDALTGATIDFGQGTGPVFPTTAIDNLDAANNEALNWASDAVLIFVGNSFLDLTPDGFSTFWSFSYYAASKDSIRTFTMASGSVAMAESASKDNANSLDALPANFCNSTEALTLAEQNSEDFRNVHPNTLVNATLSRGQLPGDSAVAVWKISYFSPVDFASLELFIDAETCNIVTDVEENSDITGIPSKYNLEQNYPNPFNPETVISYQIPQSGQTKLTIYNQLGQVMRILVNDVKSAGQYKILWNGLDQNGNQVANGVYFYRLDSNVFTQTRKMVLMR